MLTNFYAHKLWIREQWIQIPFCHFFSVFVYLSKIQIEIKTTEFFWEVVLSFNWQFVFANFSSN
jgi:hypothetical protein